MLHHCVIEPSRKERESKLMSSALSHHLKILFKAPRSSQEMGKTKNLELRKVLFKSGGSNKAALKLGMAPSTNRSQCPTFKTAPIWAVQCRECGKWRVIPTQNEYEQIRLTIKERPFTCSARENLTCNELPDIEQGPGFLWGLDKPNLPKSPDGFTRKMSLRHNLSRLEVYYETPSGKLLRRPSDVAPFLAHHPQYSHLSPADFSFKPPKIVKHYLHN